MYTAWDLIADFELWDGKKIRLINGKAFYTDAYKTKKDNVCLWRLEADYGLRVIKRYVRYNQQCEIVEG